MFTTFYGMAPATEARNNGTMKKNPAGRPKRSQVRRACDWCKLMRIKCDNYRPCSNCQQADRECAISGDNQFRSIAEAVQEVKRLRAQVREFRDNHNALSSSAPEPAPSGQQLQQHQQQHQQKPGHSHTESQQGHASPKQEDTQPLQQPQLQQQQGRHHDHGQQQEQHQQQQQPEQYQHSPQQDDHGHARHDSSIHQETKVTGCSTPRSISGQHRVSSLNTANLTATSPLSPANTPEPSLYPNKHSPITDRPIHTAASCDGVRVDSIPYGITSITFFLTHMKHFLQAARPQLRLEMDLDSTSTSAGVCRAAGSRPAPEVHVDYSKQENAPTGISANYNHGCLPRAQETLFLDLFWQTHYFSFPILNEAQFRRDFKNLWNESPPGGPRKASPLVDIVLALCVQLGGFLMSHNMDGSNYPQQNELSVEDLGTPSLGGLQYYQRCQSTMDKTIDSPSIENVQSYIFSIVYLYEAGLLNRAQVMAGKAIMMATILGLPNEPPLHLPEPQKEVLRRTWWSLYMIETKLSMETGRPPIISPSYSTCRLPSDSKEVAKWLGPHYSFDDSCPTWLGFQTQTLRLLDAVRSVRSSFYAKYDAVVGSNGHQEFVNDANAREECACLLAEQMKELNAWAKQVPQGYLVARRDGLPFSMDRNPLEFEVDMIIHCQRQRLLLELQYHHYCISLYQSFICFRIAEDEELTPVSDSKAAAALAHAMTLTSMVHQTLTNTEALSGIYHVFRWQKSALFTMLGFAYSFPLSGAAAATRKSIGLAIDVIDMYQAILPEAKTVVDTARVLAEDVNSMISSRFGTAARTRLSSPASPPNSTVVAAGANPDTSSMVSAAAAGTLDTQSDVLSRMHQTMTHMSHPVAAPLIDSGAPGQPDQNMTSILSPSATDKMLDLGFPQELGEEGANVEAMDMLWASLAPGGDALLGMDAWASMGDAPMMDGLNFGELNDSL
ncbi:fungal-specific transcription factor domain-containing protein [Xylariaceae sp. FL0016]|nr:fungal-specific transcription factor domain-containing protein [Xylariaceae sp. FL0016]